MTAQPSAASIGALVHGAAAASQSQSTELSKPHWQGSATKGASANNPKRARDGEDAGGGRVPGSSHLQGLDWEAAAASSQPRPGPLVLAPVAVAGRTSAGESQHFQGPAAASPGSEAASNSPSSGFDGDDDDGGASRKKRRQCAVACVVCAKSKSACDDFRPCARCVRQNKGALCFDKPWMSQGRRSPVPGSVESLIDDIGQKRRQLAKGMACAACTRSKTRCNGDRPCARCVRVNKGICEEKASVAHRRQELYSMRAGGHTENLRPEDQAASHLSALSTAFPPTSSHTTPQQPLKPQDIYSDLKGGIILPPLLSPSGREPAGANQGGQPSKATTSSSSPSASEWGALGVPSASAVPSPSVQALMAHPSYMQSWQILSANNTSLQVPQAHQASARPLQCVMPGFSLAGMRMPQNNTFQVLCDMRSLNPGVLMHTPDPLISSGIFDSASGMNIRLLPSGMRMPGQAAISAQRQPEERTGR